MLKKGNNIFSLLIIILSIFMTSSVNIVKADNTGSTDYGDQFVTSVKLLDASGNVMDQNTQHTLNDSMSVVWHFTVTKKINDNDTMTISIPKQFAITGDTKGDVTNTDKDKTKVIGEANVNKENRTIKVTFNQDAATLSSQGNLDGEITISTKWDSTLVSTEKPTEITWSTTNEALQNDPNTPNNINVVPSPPDSNEVLYKFGGFDNNTIKWTARINYRHDNIKNAIYKDFIGPDQTLDFSSLKAYPVTYTPGTGNYTPDKDNPYDSSIFTQTDDGFTANLGDISKTILIDYTTTITNSSSTSFANTGQLNSNQTSIQVVPVRLASTTVSGSADIQKNVTAVYGTKTWVDDDPTLRPQSIIVNLLSNGTKVGSKTVSAKDDWSYLFANLISKDTNGKDIKYTISEDPVPNYKTTIDGYNIINTYTGDSTTTPTDDTKTFSVTKNWSDNNDLAKKRPSSVQVQLIQTKNFQNTNYSNPITLTSDANGNWNYTWTNLPTKDVDGNTYTYSAKEVNTDSNYISKASTTTDKTTITNTLKTTKPGGDTGTPPSDKTHLKVKKIWSDNNNQDKLRPSAIKVQLYADGIAKGNAVTLNADNNWSYDFNNLDKGMTYTVKEKSVANYTTNIDKLDATDVQITNTHTPTTNNNDKTYLTVHKNWNDNNNQDNVRPDLVTIHLLADGIATGSVVSLNADNNWTYTWNQLDKNKQYSIREDKVSDYTTSQEISTHIINITNSHTPKSPTPNNPGNPDTTPLIPNNPGDNTGNTPGDSTVFTPDPMIPDIPYETNTNNGFNKLPQTGSKDLNILYPIIGFLILGITAILFKRKLN